MMDAVCTATEGPCNLKVNDILEGNALFDTVVSWCKNMAVCISNCNMYLFAYTASNVGVT